jgi:hypothetical protein
MMQATALLSGATADVDTHIPHKFLSAMEMRWLFPSDPSQLAMGTPEVRFESHQK